MASEGAMFDWSGIYFKDIVKAPSSLVILGYTSFNSQEELSDEIGKSLNAVKVKLSRRRQSVQENERELTFDEYKIFLANRFDKTTEEIAIILNSSTLFLLKELDEIDSLEACEFFEEEYTERIPSLDEINIFIRLNMQLQRCYITQ